MIIYYCLLSLLGASYLATIVVKDINRRHMITIYSTCVLIIIVQGLRKLSVGADLMVYIKTLREAKDLNFLAGDRIFNFEIGYSLFSQLFAKMNVSDQLYLFIVAATIILPIGYIWIKYSKIPAISAFIYLTLGFFTFSFSGLRQSIAIAIVFYSFTYVQTRKLFKFLLCLGLATAFHTSAVIFIFAYWLYLLRLKPIHYSIIIPIMTLIFILRDKIFLLMYYVYQGTPGKPESTNAYNMLIVMIVILVLAYVFGSKDDQDLNFNAYKNYLLVTIIIQIFASQSNTVMRLGYYYYIFITLLIPDVIQKQQNAKIKLAAIVVLIVSLLYFFQQRTGNGYLNVSPYHFFWE